MEPDDDDVGVRFVAAVVRGNLRLLLGMVRANRPWRLAARLSRALVAALAAVAFALVTSDIWRIADSLGWLRLLALSIVSLAAIVLALLAAHGLWERAANRRGREQTFCSISRRQHRRAWRGDPVRRAVRAHPGRRRTCARLGLLGAELGHGSTSATTRGLPGL